MTLLLATLALAAPTWPAVSTPPPLTGGGEGDAAVLVGVEDYVTLPSVTGARDNVLDWQAWLLGTRGLRPVAIEKRLDGDAVDIGIREAAKAAVARVKPGGTLWFVYVGHGAPADQGAEALLVGADAQGTPDGIRNRSVPLSEVEAILAQGPQAHTVIVLDACFSGQGSDGRDLVGETLAPARGVPEVVAPESMTTLVATSANQYAGLLPGTARPAFSYLVLGALRGWADEDGNGLVTAREAGDYAAGALKLVVTGRRQEPRVSGDDSVVLGQGRERGPDLLAMARAPAALNTGSATANLGGSTDFARAAAVAQAREEEAQRMIEEAARARAAAEAARRRGLDEAAIKVQTQAADDWAAVRPLLTAHAGVETATVLEAFIAQYDGASVTVDGVTEAVDVAEVADARTALAELRRRIGDEALAARRREEVEARAREEEAARAREEARQAEDREREAARAREVARDAEAEQRPPATTEPLPARSTSQASVTRREGPSAKVPLLVTGGIAAAGGAVLLVAASAGEEQALSNASSGAVDEDESAAQRETVNTMYGASYALLGVGVVLGGIGLAVPVHGDGLALVVRGDW